MLSYLLDDLRTLNHSQSPSRTDHKSVHIPYITYRNQRGTAATPSWLTGVPATPGMSTYQCHDQLIKYCLAEHSVSDVVNTTSADQSVVTPADCAVSATAQSIGRGGGVVIIYRHHLKCSQVASTAGCRRVSRSNPSVSGYVTSSYSTDIGLALSVPRCPSVMNYVPMSLLSRVQYL